jgi:hypothetical protein
VRDQPNRTWHVPLEQADKASERALVRYLVLVLRPDGHQPHDEAGLLLNLLPAMQPAGAQVLENLRCRQTLAHASCGLHNCMLTERQF